MSNTSSGSSIKSEETGPGTVAGDGVLRLSASQETRPTDPAKQKAQAGRPVEMRLEWRIMEVGAPCGGGVWMSLMGVAVKVEKLLRAYDHKECVPSKPFLFPQAPNVLWQLDFYPNGRNDSSGASIHLSQMESMVSLYHTAPAPHSPIILPFCSARQGSGGPHRPLPDQQERGAGAPQQGQALLQQLRPRRL